MKGASCFEYKYSVLIFFMVDGREKLPYCKVLVKPLASGYVSIFETYFLMTVSFLAPSCFPLILKEFMID